jgi:hypothetical protein
MLFNLSCCRHFPSKKIGTGILCNSDLGPYFEGESTSELSAWDEPFNGEGKCNSYANQPSYCIPVDSAGLNMLTNRKNGGFTITELEVW